MMWCMRIDIHGALQMYMGWSGVHCFNSFKESVTFVRWCLNIATVDDNADRNFTGLFYIWHYWFIGTSIQLM